MRAFISVAATLLAIPASAAAAGGTFTLSIFQGFHFASGQVVKSGTDTADLSFTYQTRRIGFISYLGADKISFFEAPPGNVSPSEVNGWKDYVAGPEPGYYVLRARSNQRLYLVRLVEFSDQGKAASYWRMRFEWQELGGAAARRTSASRYSDDSRPSGSDDRAEQSIPLRRSPQAQRAESRERAAGDPSLHRAGHDVAYEARRRVALQVELITPLTRGLGGELKWIALCESGTREKVGTDMILATGNLSLSVPPGRYDLWIEGRNDRREMIRTVDLSGYEIGDVVTTTVRFPGWDAAQPDVRRQKEAASPERLPTRTDTRRSTYSGNPAVTRDDLDDTEERIRRAQEKAEQRGTQRTNDDLEERIRRAQERAKRRNQ